MLFWAPDFDEGEMKGNKFFSLCNSAACAIVFIFDSSRGVAELWPTAGLRIVPGMWAGLKMSSSMREVVRVMLSCQQRHNFYKLGPPFLVRRQCWDDLALGGFMR